MARPAIRSENHALPARMLFRLFRAVASLQLAVFVIAASAVVLGWATRVEGNYGGDAARFGIYGSWWFTALMALLGLNVLAAALVRFPWKRQQTGFVITHAGILVLVAGCWLSRQGGIDAQLPVFEGRSGSVAYEDTQHFQLKILPQSPAGADVHLPHAQTTEIPFASGPFNWADYRDKLFWFPWLLGHRDRGVVYDRDAIRLEVLDYYADSRLATVPPLELRARRQSADHPSDWEPVKLDVRLAQDPKSPRKRVAVGSRQTLSGGERITFSVAAGQAETEAFLNSGPKGPLADEGQIVLYARGHAFHLPVAELEGRGSMPLGDTGLNVTLDRLDKQFSGVILRIEGGRAGEERMVLLADFPEFNQQAAEHGVFGTYWADASSQSSQEPSDQQPEPPQADSPLAHAHEPRVDVIEGTDGKLYYRTWKSPRLGTIGPLLLDRPTVVRWGGGEAPLELQVARFTPQDAPGQVVEPLPYTKQQKKMSPKQARARVRLTVDGASEEFWLEAMEADPFHTPPDDGQRHVVHGDLVRSDPIHRVSRSVDSPDRMNAVTTNGPAGGGRTVEVTLRRDEVDVGFSLYLDRFQRKLDPGTSMASHYSSLVDLRDRNDPKKVLREKILITLNEPVNFTDPNTGRSYRVYQESFAGPWKPGEPIFNELVSGDDPRDEIFLSWLTVNYDPGRGLKYFGSLLIVAGIATMFYMKAYFFKPSGKPRQGNCRAEPLHEEAQPRRQAAIAEPEPTTRD